MGYVLLATRVDALIEGFGMYKKNRAIIITENKF